MESVDPRRQAQPCRTGRIVRRRLEVAKRQFGRTVHAGPQEGLSFIRDCAEGR